eukprot:2510590-Rhodomonas_salina.1
MPVRGRPLRPPAQAHWHWQATAAAAVQARGHGFDNASGSSCQWGHQPTSLSPAESQAEDPDNPRLGPRTHQPPSDLRLRDAYNLPQCATPDSDSQARHCTLCAFQSSFCVPDRQLRHWPPMPTIQPGKDNVKQSSSMRVEAGTQMYLACSAAVRHCLAGTAKLQAVRRSTRPTHAQPPRVPGLRNTDALRSHN